MSDRRAARRLFSTLPRAERFHVWARDVSAPLERLADLAPGGRIADVGCGHGLLCALLAHGRADRQVVGVDPDPRKIAHAKQALGGLGNVSVDGGTLETLLLVQPGSFDAVVVADVLYLLPLEAWPGFLGAARALLRPGGQLLLKEARGDGSWRHQKCLAQEWVMVRLLRRTKDSGGLTLLPEAQMRARLLEAGFHDVRVEDLSGGYTTPHVLYVAR